MIQHMPVVGSQRRRGPAFPLVFGRASIDVIANEIEKETSLPKTSRTAVFKEGVSISKPFPDDWNLRAMQVESDRAGNKHGDRQEEQ